jgi:hypothetical protein
MRKISAAMFHELTQTLSTEDSGYAGRPTEFFDAASLTAIYRRGLVEFHTHMGWRLTAAGRKAVGR